MTQPRCADADRRSVAVANTSGSVNKASGLQRPQGRSDAKEQGSAMDQLSLTNPRDALHRDEHAANK